MDMRVRFPLKRNMVYMDEQSGRAIICDWRGRRFTYDASSDTLERFDQLHVGMYLQSAMTVITTRRAWFYPFTRVRKYLKLSHDRELALRLFLKLILEKDDGSPLRAQLPRVIDEVIARDGVYSWVRKIVLATPLPDIAILPTNLAYERVAMLVADVRNKWRPDTITNPQT